MPDLAESWSWDSTKTRLTFKLRQGVKWHDGKPFTAKDVECTWNKLLGKDADVFRKNPRAIWYQNVKEIAVNGDQEATFVLNRPQRVAAVHARVGLLARLSLPRLDARHAHQADRHRPLQVRGVQAERGHPARPAIRTTSKKGRPLDDAIEMRIIANRSTRILAFVAGEFDMTFSQDITIPLLKDIKSQAPNAICEIKPQYVPRNLMVNREKPPFNDAKLRDALALAIDRKPFIDILTEGKGDIGGVMLPLPEGLWGMPPEVLKHHDRLRRRHREEPGRGTQDHGGPGLQRVRTRSR